MFGRGELDIDIVSLGSQGSACSHKEDIKTMLGESMREVLPSGCFTCFANSCPCLDIVS